MFLIKIIKPVKIHHAQLNKHCSLLNANTDTAIIIGILMHTVIKYTIVIHGIVSNLCMILHVYFCNFTILLPLILLFKTVILPILLYKIINIM